MNNNNIANRTVKDIELQLATAFDECERVAYVCQRTVLNAFTKHKIQASCFAPSSGYAYNDRGRESLNAVFADIFGFEDAIVSNTILSGTHALYTTLKGLLRVGDTLLSITGDLYDSVQGVISGHSGALDEFGVKFDKIDFADMHTAKFDTDAITRYLASKKPKVVYIQRSSGYSSRKALHPSDIERISRLVKDKHKNAIIVVDNCYGEFVCDKEPSKYIDVLAGSLIKNPGGGIVQVGGYIVGSKACIQSIAYCMVAPSIGVEIGANTSGYRDYFLGLFLAPHIVLQAKKSALLFGQGFGDKGYTVSVGKDSVQSDIICVISLGSEDNIKRFCSILQSLSPIDSFVVPEPFDMAGYDNKIIMSGGTFTLGSTIELSADAPIREPYNVYLQGALTYEHAKIVFEEIIKQF